MVIVFSAPDASGAECPDGAGSSRDVHLYGRRGAVAVSYFSERRNGGGADAGHRNPFAAYEFGRFQYLVGIFNAGAGK